MLVIARISKGLFVFYTRRLGSLVTMIKAIFSDFNFVLWNGDEFEHGLNTKLSEFYRELIKQDISTYIVTAGGMAATREVGAMIGDYLKGVFIPHRIGKSKSDPKFYTWMLEELNFEASEVIFIDDQPTNVAAAKAAGLYTITFEDTQDTILDITRIIAQNNVENSN